jgi:quinolinate synthase
MVRKKESLLNEIRLLKEENDAVILAHNYQVGEVQDIADIIGDSLELSRAAATMEGDVIVFCGVDFMAETAAILSPGKTVLLPASDACCPMAEMISADELKYANPGTRMQQLSVTSIQPPESKLRVIYAALHQMQ